MMRAYCISSSYCQYKTDTGYCGYTGNGCVQGLVRSVRYDGPTYTIVRQVELTDECINKIAEAVVENCGTAERRWRVKNEHTEKTGRWIEDNDPTLPSHCSVCGEYALEWVETRYCPWCGAKMEGPEE